VRIVVVGAGLAGLAAGGALTAAGHDVTVLDKGRSPGGRLATRRIGTATLDHGAQFFTVRSDRFAAVVEPHRSSGLVYEWSRGFVDGGDGYPRYAAHGGMNALAKVLAHGLDVRAATMVFAIRAAPTGSAHRWDVALDDGSSLPADALVVTCPVPQSYSLLASADVELPADLIRIEYDRTIALLVTLDGPSAVGEPGGLQNPSDSLSFVSDNCRKGISTTDALTIHASAAWSAAHWNDDHAAVDAALRLEAAAFLGSSRVTAAEVKKWRFATPHPTWADPCWIAPAGLLVLAGDAFAGPKVEGAALSGLAAADALAS